MSLITHKRGSGLGLRHAVLAASALAWAAPGVFAATITVDDGGDTSGGDDCTLRDAISSANANTANGGCSAGDDNDDTIVFADGVSGATIALQQGVLPSVSGPLTITGPVTVDAAQRSRIFINQSDLALEQLTLINGRTATASDASADARSGGAVLNDDGGVLTVTGGAMNNNTADRAGGAIEQASGAGDDTTAITLTNVDFSGNDAGANPGNGGVLHVTGSTDIRVTGGTFDGNTATEGGALWNNAGAMTVDSARFTGNSATGGDTDTPDQGGGAIFANTAGGVVNVTASVFDGNRAAGDVSSGGAIFVNEGVSLMLADSTLTGNTANRAGGGIELRNASTANLNNVSASGNTANPTAGGGGGNGGVLHVTGSADVELVGGTYANNTAVEGGALWNNQGNMSLDGVTVVGNTATGNEASQGGGGLYSEAEASDGDGAGTLTITASRIANNSASGDSGSGGGILVSPGATLDMRAGSIAGNNANRAGGGIENANGTVTLTHVTLGGTAANQGNDAGATPGNGGGMHIGGAGSGTLVRSSVGFNTAVEGGGLWNSGAGSLTVATTTVSNNSADTGAGLYVDGDGGTIDADFVSVTRNNGTGVAAPNGGRINIDDSLIADNDTNLGTGVTASRGDGNTVADNASLGDYRLFGGPTATQPLMAASTALDTNADCGDDDDDTDQRGAERPADAADGDTGDGDGDCDSGAFERTDDPVLAVTANGPDTVTVGGDDNPAPVLAFTLRNNSEDSVTVGGFSGFIARDARLPAGLDLSEADLTVFADDNANGRADSGENQVASASIDDNGYLFSGDFDNGAGVSIPGNDRVSYVVVASVPANSTALASLTRTAPLVAGGALLGLLGLATAGGGPRRRTHYVLLLGGLALALTACSDDVGNVDLFGNNGGGANPGPMTSGQARFVLQTLDTPASADDGDLVIGDGLPVRGPVVSFAVSRDDG